MGGCKTSGMLKCVIVSAALSMSGSATDSTVLTISGHDFGDDVTNNTVVIGDESCVILSSSSTVIECQIGQGKPGQHRVEVYVYPYGSAVHTEGDIYFSYEFDVDDSKPTSGSLAGHLFEPHLQPENTASEIK